MKRPQRRLRRGRACGTADAGGRGIPPAMPTDGGGIPPYQWDGGRPRMLRGVEGEGRVGAATVDEVKGHGTGAEIVGSVDLAARTAVGDVATDQAVGGKRGPPLRTRSRHGRRGCRFRGRGRASMGDLPRIRPQKEKQGPPPQTK